MTKHMQRQFLAKQQTEDIAAEGTCIPGVDECFPCFECLDSGRCKPISGCVPSCESDADCDPVQICTSEGLCDKPENACQKKCMDGFECVFNADGDQECQKQSSSGDSKRGGGSSGGRGGGKSSGGKGGRDSYSESDDSEDPDRDVGCCMALDWSVRDATKCNRAYKAVYCNTEPGWDNCQWVNDRTHKVQDDCDAPDELVFAAHVNALGQSAASDGVSVMPTLVLVVAAVLMYALSRCWNRMEHEGVEKPSDTLRVNAPYQSV